VPISLVVGPRVRRVAIQGEPGSYSEEAAYAFLGADIDLVSVHENLEATRALAASQVDCAVLPIENSLSGSVCATYDAILAEPAVRVTGQLVLPIHHCVLGVAGATLATVRTIESHPVALAQCRQFFQAHAAIRRRVSHDTAGAAREVAASDDPTRGAIASAMAAQRYGLQILARNAEDRADNRTRFVVLATAAASPAPSARSRTMVVYETMNEPGALVRTLVPLARRRLNVAKIEARPADTPWSYRFVVEFEHTGGVRAACEAIKELALRTGTFRHLGTFSSETTSRE
jgi:prephenate dehydratase